MRYREIHLRSIGPFQDTTLRLDDVAGPLVAVTGENGAGKTTLLECFPAAVWQRTVTAGGGVLLKDLATGRDALLDAVIEAGHAELRFQHMIDAHTGKGEVVVTNGAETPLASGRAACKAWAAEHMPAAEVVYAAVFGAQGGDGAFIGLDPGDRKAVMVRVLGHTYLEQLAEDARKRANAAQAEAEKASAGAAAWRDRAGRLEPLERQQADLAAQLENAEQRLIDAELVEAWKSAERDAAVALERLKAVEQAAKDAEQAAKQLEACEEAARQLDAARERETAATRAADAAREHLRRADQRAREARRAADQTDHALSRVRSDAKALESQHANAARTRQQGIEAVEADLADNLEELRAAYQQAHARADHHDDRAWRYAEAATRLQRSQAGKRGQLLAKALGALRKIADGAPAPAEIAQRAIEQHKHLASTEHDANIEAARLTANQRHDDSRDQSRQALQRAKELERRIEAAERAAEHVERLRGDAAEAERTFAERRAELAAQEQRRLEAAAAYEEAAQAAEVAAEEARAAATAADDHLRTCQAETARVTPLVAGLDAARAAAAKLDELHDHKLDVGWYWHEAEEARAAAHKAVDHIAADMRDELLGASTSARSDVDRLRNAHTTTSTQLTAAREAAAKLSELEDQRRTHEQDAADWKKLGDDLGRKGVQALELDDAAPTLTEITNDLLHRCFGTRFTVRFETTAPKRSGKGQKEGFWCWVYDARANREGEAKSFSGGEKVIIGEAVSLALALLAAQRAGLRNPTLVRDETAAALRGDNREAYIAMLRRAAEIVDADKVLFIPADGSLAELADGRIHINGGKVEVA